MKGKTEPPFVTVLMPVFNGEKHLREAIESILGQTFPGFELLIVNDGSTDRTSQVVGSFSDPRIRLLVNPSNLGLAKTLNNGIRVARGYYVARMDADDISLPERLERQIGFMESNTRVAICGTWVQTFDGSSDTWTYPTDSDELRCRLLFETVFCHPSVMIRKESLLRSNLRYNETLSTAQDYDLWSRISEKYDLANLPEVLLKYRIHCGSVTSKRSKEQDEVSRKVRRLQLERLGVSPDETQLDLHESIAQQRFNPSLVFLSSGQKWLLQIVAANKHSSRYQEAAMLNVVTEYWERTITRSANLGVITPYYLWLARLSRNLSIGHRTRIRYLIQSKITRKPRESCSGSAL